MKITFKGVFTIEEHLLIIGRLKNEHEGSWEVSRRPSGVPQIVKVGA
jgi:hypothetical protein